MDVVLKSSAKTTVAASVLMDRERAAARAQEAKARRGCFMFGRGLGIATAGGGDTGVINLS
jgi:hypothetical protein